MTRFVVMGVSGCGKTSVGQAVAARCDSLFIDGDDLHPARNVAKMSSGVPLTDEDRAPWLADVGHALKVARGPVLIGCSALKRRYRDWIRQEVGGPVHFLHLDAPKPVLAERVATREGHFMPPGLLDSQFAALEPLEDDELGTRIDITPALDVVIAATEAHVRKVLA